MSAEAAYIVVLRYFSVTIAVRKSFLFVLGPVVQNQRRR